MAKGKSWPVLPSESGGPDATAFRVEALLTRRPRVGPPPFYPWRSEPWAVLFNPFGIGSLPEQHLDLGLGCREMVLNRAPDNHVVHRIITVDDAVAEVHDVPERRDASGNGGSQTVEAVQASPMISNSRSTARRNQRSAVYSSNVCPAHRCSMLWQASETSRRSFFSSALIDGLAGRLDDLAEIGIAQERSVTRSTGVKATAPTFGQSEVVVRVIGGRRIVERHEEIQVAGLRIECAFGGRAKEVEAPHFETAAQGGQRGAVSCSINAIMP